MTYLTFKDIAKELQVSLRTVSRMVADGLPVIHVHGRIYRVHRDALDQFLKQRTGAASPSEQNWRRSYTSKYSAAEIELLAMREKRRQKNN
ncbi:DNA binding domain-containing protein, excisionase family [Nitrosospira multiformis]|uniref:DNA binding domain-containing protein, excisionase family n=1 Tax=Nitrosospira multiformis TaxID=1231 RepID=A0A1H8P6G5_9PROT|nr:DNA binding domain-containing protein, excisionase family [Nitrosospira multiformis]